ncbi:hypothetical protein QA942_19815 [Streptomyces sp. B21-106]|uniref:hypothetical protein n=1 Tax=Streptomyces sp. B21-106 TaxID=3039418 RepID=UPI002FF41C31
MPTPKPKRLGDPNRSKVLGFQGATTEALRTVRLEGKAPAGQTERQVSYDPEAVRAAIAAQRCPFCGKGPYKVIAVHTNKTHGVDKYELRDLAGLSTQDSICAPEYSERARENAIRNEIYKRGNQSPKQRRPQRWTSAGRDRNRSTIIAVNGTITAEERLAAAAKASMKRLAKETCKHGHPWAEHARISEDGSRTCRACEKDRSRERHGFVGTHEVVDATGTVRRLQALAAIGYPVQETARRLGLSLWWATNIMKRERQGSGVVCSTAEAAAALYEELRSVPAPDTKGAKISRTMAAKKGWAPPSAWSAQTLDDPSAGLVRPDEEQT